MGLLFLALLPYALHIEPWLDPAHRRPPVVLITTRSVMSATHGDHKGVLWALRVLIYSGDVKLLYIYI